MKTQLSVIVPVKNEADNIIPFYYELIKHIPESFELIWVNDSSEDSTLEEIKTLTRRDERVKCLLLKTSCGEEAAVMAGLDYACGDYIIIMKGDLQHPPNMICHLLSNLEKGDDIVNTVITNRVRVTWAQKWSMDLYYALIHRLTNDTDFTDLTQFRGFRRSVINDILFVKEKHFFPADYFNWSTYAISSIKYKNRRTSRKDIRYTKENLVHTTNTFVKNSVPGFLKSLVVFGATICVASLFFIFLFIVEFYKGHQVHTGALSLTSLLFAGGLQIFVYSSYKKKIKGELYKLCQNHHYIVKKIIEPDPFLSKYGMAGSVHQD